MTQIARRQHTKSAETEEFLNGNGHSIAKTKTTTTTTTSAAGNNGGGVKRKILLSFLSGACCMGLVIFSWRDNLLTVQTNNCATHSPLTDIVDDGTTSQNNANSKPSTNMEDWKWYKGDVNQYYNELEKDIQRNPKNLDGYAVHRWMGSDRSTKHHYELLLDSIARYTGLTAAGGMDNLHVLDAGCGLGAAMMYMEQKHPSWNLVGATLSEEQIKFIEQQLAPHKFRVELRSYDDLPNGVVYDAMYSIEAMIHSTDIRKTLRAWADHLHPQHGTLAIIDDFLMPTSNNNDPRKDDTDVQLFAKGWMANALYTVTELGSMARPYGLELVEARDLTAEFRVVELNYNNQVPDLSPDGMKTHQGWIGSKFRHKLTVEGKLGYYMLVFRKMSAKKPNILAATTAMSSQTPLTTTVRLAANTNDANDNDDKQCETLPIVSNAITSRSAATFREIRPKKECISSWYCCDQGAKFFDDIDSKRTHSFGFLKLDRNIFGNYMEVFAKHLNNFYRSLPADYLAQNKGKFLDIGATGSTASGMTQVTTKFQHFAGPLQYWMLDSDVGAKTLNKTIYCDIVDCQIAETCGFDVTFSHTVLEHASRPDKAFDTIARITKRGGLTMHLVPWSYQYHATPDDYYRFSHSALRVLMEDRGFEPLEIGYDLCSKQESHRKTVDEHYDFIWLTYVVARKK